MRTIARFALVPGIVLATLFAGSLSAQAVTSLGTDLSTDGTLSVAGNAVFDTNTLFVNAAGNLVGILTAAPTSELDVRDSSPTPTTNIFQVANANDSARYLTVSSTSTKIVGAASITGAFSVSGNAAFDTNTLAVDAALHRVGIGTSSPSFLLDVSGQARIAGTALFSGSIGIGNAAPANALTVGSSTSTFEVNASGNLIKVNNVVYAWPSAQGGGSTFLSNDGSGNLSWTSPSSSVSSLNQAYLAATGSPEISVSPAVGAVTIADAIGGTGNIFEIQNRTTSGGAYSTQYLTVSSTSTSIVGATSITGALSATGNVVFDTNTLFLDAAANRVGIGTASPTANLEVAGQVKFTGTSFPLLNVIRTSSGDGTQLYAGMLLEREIASASAVNGSGVAIYFKSVDSSQTREYSGIIGSGLDNVTNGSEIGFIGFKAAYQANDPSAGQAYGLKLVAASTTVDNAIFSGNVGIRMTGTPNSELDLRDSSPTPTTDIFHVADANDSSRYFTVSSTSTSIQTGLDLEDGTGSVTSDAVTINAVSGVITDSTDIASNTTRAPITFTNSRLTATSIVTVTMCSTPDANAMIAAAVTPGSGSATLSVRNVGTASQTSDFKLCFRINN